MGLGANPYDLSIHLTSYKKWIPFSIVGGQGLHHALDIAPPSDTGTLQEFIMNVYSLIHTILFH